MQQRFQGIQNPGKDVDSPLQRISRATVIDGRAIECGDMCFGGCDQEP